MKSLLVVTTIFFIKTVVFPDIDLLAWAIIAICVDFVTGILKARIKRVQRTSTGFRKTIIKLAQYGGAIIVGMVLSGISKVNEVEKATSLLNYFNNGLVSFIIYIECTSIFENLYEIDKTSYFGRYFVKNILNILTFQIKNNPSTQHNEKSTDQLN